MLFACEVVGEKSKGIRMRRDVTCDVIMEESCVVWIWIAGIVDVVLVGEERCRRYL